MSPRPYTRARDFESWLNVSKHTPEFDREKSYFEYVVDEWIDLLAEMHSLF